MTALGWSRKEAGWYTTEVDGQRVDVVNMQGQSVRYSGLGAHVEVRVGGDAEYGTGARTIHSDYTIRDAKRWVADNIDILVRRP